MKHQKLNREQAVTIIEQTVVSVLFDVLQDGELINLVPSMAEPIKNLGDPLVILNGAYLLQEAHTRWEGWREAGLARYSPWLAPYLLRPDELQKRTQPKRVFEKSVGVA